MKKLSDYGYNKYSQFGEDGIIDRIFHEIRPASRLCVEFGAWDGLHLSNTANLWTNGWKAVLIEGLKSRYEALVRNVAGHDVLCVNAFVGHQAHDSLEAILASHRVSEPIDLLSVDIDGDDYYIIGSLGALRPRVIICEYNPTIPAHIDLFAEPGSGFGCSLAALERVARVHGYHLVAVTDTNGFFVQEREAHHFGGYERRSSELRIDRHLVYLMTGYGGDYVASGVGPYGCARPCAATLYGPHHRVGSASPFRAGAARLLRRIKALVGR